MSRCYCKCPTHKRATESKCTDCGIDGSICCLKADGPDGVFYFRKYKNNPADIPFGGWVTGDACDVSTDLQWEGTGSSNTCGSMRGVGGCNTLLGSIIQWQVDGACTEIIFDLYLETSPGSHTKYSTSLPLDWVSNWSDFTCGPLDFTQCGAELVPPTRSFCCFDIETASRGTVRVYTQCADDPRALRATTDQCGQVGASFGSFGVGVTWGISDDFTEIEFTLYGGGAPLPDCTFTIPYTADWLDNGYSFPACGTSPAFFLDPTCGNPCDSSSQDCFPDCISAMGDPDCTVPQHSLLFAEFAGPSGLGCCLDGTYDFPYTGGRYYLAATETECVTGGDSVYVSLEMTCSGSNINLTVTRFNQQGTLSSSTSTISLTCVDGEVNYSFTFGARFMCDGATIGQTFTVTIFSNNA